MSTEKYPDDWEEYCHCFACGRENHEGLRLHFDYDETGSEAHFVLDKKFEGFPDIIHGGIVSTVLDEAMAYAVHGAHKVAFTARMNTEFKRIVHSGVEYIVRGRITEQRGRMLQATAEILDSEGNLYARTEAIWLEKRLTGTNSSVK